MNKRTRKQDPVAIIEAAYSDGPQDRWLRNILLALEPLVPDATAHLANTIDCTTMMVHDDVVSLQPSDTVRKLASLYRRDPYQKTFEPILLSRRPVATGSSILGSDSLRTSPWSPILNAFGGQDALGLLALDPTGRGVAISIALSRMRSATRREERLLGMFGVHIAAAYRLRTALLGPPDGDAVLRPDGSVVHAERDARPKRARQRLRDYAVAVERARGRLRARAPDEAVALWTGLTAGVWSLVDRFDRDGKRYLIARKNTADARFLFSLTPRESQVVGYAVLGHSNKSIAYALGISQSTVSASERSAMVKLGVRSRAELVKLAGDIGRAIRGGARTADEHSPKK